MTRWLPEPGQKAMMTIEVEIDADGDLMASNGRGCYISLDETYAQPSDAQEEWGAVFAPLGSSVEGAE